MSRSAAVSHDSSLVGFIQNMISGGMSGIVSKTISAPVDRVKLILQTQAVNSDVTTRYNGLLDCFKRVYKEQGFLSFWRGNGANLIRYFPHQALTFAFKDKFRALASFGDANSGPQSVPFWKIVTRNILAGGAGGGISLVMLYPLDMARTRLAADTGSGKKRRFRGTVDCLQKIYAENGLKGIYTGIGVSITGVVVFRGLFLGGYDTIKDVMDLGSSQDLTKANKVTNAGNAGKDAGLKYRGAVHAFFTILKEEGFRALYSGLSANLIRGFAGPILLVSYDIFKSGMADKS
eukprot:GSChrysophyteH1.ASY1.ANO1.904.1 assembled CDS